MPKTKPDLIMNGDHCYECGEVHPVKNIYESNRTLPDWPERMPLWQKILCLLGYHKWEMRQGCPKHMGSLNGKPIPIPNMRLRNQCGRCGTLQ